MNESSARRVFATMFFFANLTLKKQKYMAKHLIIEKSNNTPYFELNRTSGYLKLEGRAIPENPSDFFAPIVSAIDEYFESPQEKTRFDMNLEYINSGSSKYLLSLFRDLQKHGQKGNDILINWYYEEDDEDMLEAGEDYQSILKIPFKMIEMEE